MKKLMAILTIILWLPINIFAYSEYLIPGGENIGISINTNGLIVVGFYKVNNKYIGKENLKIGDAILSIEGMDVNSINEMANIIDDNIENGKVNIVIKRNKKLIETKLSLVKDNNVYKTGLYVKEKVNGIGTLTYIDPVTKIFGALGHEIILSDTNERVEVKDGKIFESIVNSVDRSVNGTVGSKNATIIYDNILGSITKNTTYGLFGKYFGILPLKENLEVAKFSEIKKGKAQIYTIISDNKIKVYNIKITEINKDKINTSKAISFEITDESLLEESGGIVQGMSGSPIIQNNKIIGAVTHVVIENVKRGYAIFIRTMLEEGEK